MSTGRFNPKECTPHEMDQVLGLLHIACREECRRGDPIMVNNDTLSWLIEDWRALRADNTRLQDRIKVLTTEMDATLDLRMKIKRMDEVVSAARACTVWEDRETFEAMRAAVGEYDAAEESLAVHRPGEGKS
jgi:hypothetical protein